MLAAYCDGCMKEIVSDSRVEMISFMSEHYEHFRTWSMAMNVTVNEAPQDMVMQR
jgi:hypothetical protein